MKSATIHEIKKELDSLPATETRAICVRLAKYKKENKELLTYLLFDAHDEHAYIESVKQDVTEQFQAITNLNIYYAKKSLRKILRTVNKQVRYSGLPATELELRIHFCQHMKDSGIAVSNSAVLMNLYQQQIKKIIQVRDKLNEDLQFDYQQQIEMLMTKSTNN